MAQRLEGQGEQRGSRLPLGEARLPDLYVLNPFLDQATALVNQLAEGSSANPLTTSSIQDLHETLDGFEAALRSAKGILMLAATKRVLDNAHASAPLDAYEQPTARQPGDCILVIPTDRITGIGVLPMEHAKGSNVFSPILDLRIQTPTDPKISYFDYGLKYRKSPGLWYRLPLLEIELAVISPVQQ